MTGLCMIRTVAIFCASLSACLTFDAANCQEIRAPAPATPMIERGGYVRLEVTLTTTVDDKTITFSDACPKQSLWGIDLKSLLSGSKNVTLGVSIASPGLDAIEFTPVAIDKKRSGLLGLSKSCNVMIDQMRYLSPAYFVRSYENQQFSVAPTFTQVNGVNPGLAATIDTALSIAAQLASVPVETAKPFQASVKSALGQVAVSGNEKLPKRPLIKLGPVPADTDFQWQTKGLFTVKDAEKPLDVVLTARLIPVATLIPDPAPDAAGQVKWSVSDVLSSPFAANLAPVAIPGGTLRSYVSTVSNTDLANFHISATKTEASNSCDPILTRIRAMGLSDRDAALLIWAVVHDRAPAAVSTFDIDHLDCLKDAWQYAPTSVVASRVTAPPVAKPVATPGRPTTVKRMKATTQVDDAFAIFFRTSIWTERRKVGTALFHYPAQYKDTGSLLFDATSDLENVDQWLAIHTAATPIADRIGCYTYVPAADASGKSLMYAVAEMVAEKASPQALLLVTFANVADGDDAQIESIEVTASVSDEQKGKILAANGSLCSSGYKPALVFGN
jgi:hypothetical protein